VVVWLSSKIGLDDTLVALDPRGRPLGDLLAIVEHENLVAQPHHDLHVVFDDQDGLALVAQAPEHVQQLVEQRAVDPGGRFIEQDQLRIGHQHANELEQLLLAVREVAGVFLAQPLELDEGQQLLRPLPRRVDRRVGHGQQVLERRQLREYADHLEGAADAAPGDAVRLEPVDPLAVEQDRTAVQPLQAGNAVEQRGLARAVGPDQAADLAGRNRQRAVVDRRDAAELLGGILDFENGVTRHVRRSVAAGNTGAQCPVSPSASAGRLQ
jgi:hypothetical protein